MLVKNLSACAEVHVHEQLSTTFTIMTTTKSITRNWKHVHTPVHDTRPKIGQQLVIAQACEVAAHNDQPREIDAASILRRLQTSFAPQEPRLDEKLSGEFACGCHEFILPSMAWSRGRGVYGLKRFVVIPSGYTAEQVPLAIEGLDNIELFSLGILLDELDQMPNQVLDTTKRRRRP